MKPLVEFYKYRVNEESRRSSCGECQNKNWAKNKDRYNRQQRAHYKTLDSNIKQERNRQKKEWIKNNPERYKQQQLRNGKGILRLRFKILSKYNFTCQYCGRKAPSVELQVDHIIPKAKGGKYLTSNLTVACTECNVGKGDVLLNQ